ncbi:MAG: Uma2 family endonuclease [Candidatus Sericytochromatia bacterium]|nr:Uma2 family endonuclease [Candidatus Tanganyikabacteria bacterium]
MAVAEIRLKKWTREEWHRLIDLGVLDDLRVELLDGDIVEMSPQSEVHAGTVRIAAKTLDRAFGDEYTVSTQLPLALGGDELSEPEPDITVSHGSVREFARRHPEFPILIVEVAVSSEEKDRRVKASLYARAGRPEYWILVPEKETLEVYRDPVRDGKGFYDGWSYGTVATLRKGDAIAPLSLPGAEIPVADLLP